MKPKFFFISFLFFLISPSVIFSQVEEEEWINKGLQYEGKGDYSNAIVCYDTAIQLNEANAIAFYNRGVCYMAMESYGSSLVDFNKAIWLDSLLADGYYNRGIVYEKLDNPVLARYDFEKYIQMQEYDTLGYMALGDLLLNEQEFETAISIYSKLFNLGIEQMHGVYYSIALCQMNLNQWDKAIANLTEAILLRESFIEALFMRSRCYLHSKQYFSAIADLEKVLGAEPNKKEALVSRAEAYYKVEGFEQSLADYKRLEQLEPGNWYWIFEKANCYTQLQEFETAESEYSISLKTSKEPSLVLLMRGIVRKKQGKDEEACFDWQQASLMGAVGSEELISTYCNP